MSVEIWKAVPGFEGFYEVSNLGRVRSLDRDQEQRCRWGGTLLRHYKGRVLRGGLDERGRPSVSMWRLGVCLRRNVSVLVAAAFIGPRPEGMDVCHGDGDHANNVLSNLRYDTPVGNAADKILHGTHLFGERTPAAKLTEKQVRKILASAASGVTLADAYNVTPAAISAIRTGKNWSHLRRGASS